MLFDCSAYQVHFHVYLDTEGNGFVENMLPCTVVEFLDNIILTCKNELQSSEWNSMINWSIAIDP